MSFIVHPERRSITMEYKSFVLCHFKSTLTCTFWTFLCIIWHTTHFNSLRPSDAYICVGNLTVIGFDNGLSPGRCQAIIWTNTGIVLIGPLGTNSSEILIDIYTFSFKKMHLKMSSGKWGPFFSRPQCVNICFRRWLNLYCHLCYAAFL